MSTETPTPLDLAAQLIVRARTDGRASASGAVDAAATAFQSLAAELSRWLGASGSHALLTRALKQAAADHPALAEVGISSGPKPRFDRLTESVEAHGAKHVSAGMEAALVALLGLVGRLIGDDLSVKLVELSMTNGVPDAATSEDKRAP